MHGVHEDKVKVLMALYHLQDSGIPLLGKPPKDLMAELWWSGSKAGVGVGVLKAIAWEYLFFLFFLFFIFFKM